MALAAFFSVLSFLVFLGQVTIFTDYDVSVFGNITKIGEAGFFQTQVGKLLVFSIKYKNKRHPYSHIILATNLAPVAICRLGCVLWTFQN